MCSQTGRGRLENRIFGNSIRPEDCPDQILTRLAFAFGIGFGHEPAISRLEIVACGSFSLHAPLRQRNQRPAHREMLFPGNALDLDCQFRGNSNTLPHGRRRSRTRPRTSLGRPFHNLMLSEAPAWSHQPGAVGLLDCARIGFVRKPVRKTAFRDITPLKANSANSSRKSAWRAARPFQSLTHSGIGSACHTTTPSAAAKMRRGTSPELS
jgi:hypothetical protein